MTIEQPPPCTSCASSSLAWKIADGVALGICAVTVISLLVAWLT